MRHRQLLARSDNRRWRVFFFVVIYSFFFHTKFISLGSWTGRECDNRRIFGICEEVTVSIIMSKGTFRNPFGEEALNNLTYYISPFGQTVTLACGSSGSRCAFERPHYDNIDDDGGWIADQLAGSVWATTSEFLLLWCVCVCDPCFVAFRQRISCILVLLFFCYH